MKKVIIAAMIGNALEWYDYALYAQFIDIISQLFFPNSEIKEILTFAVFAAGFVVRPLGGIVLGIIGDKYGRRTALMVGMISMALPTAAIGMLPTYQSIGIAAPIILTIIRLVQGFSLGGELSGCTIYLVELAPKGYRGLVGSLSLVSACIGMLVGSTIANCCYRYMEHEQLLAWGWRVPFLGGLIIGLIGIYIRKNLAESPVYQSAKTKDSISKVPLRELFIKYKQPFFIAMGLYVTLTSIFYAITVYMENLMKYLEYLPHQISITNTTILLTIIIMTPIVGLITDKIGRKPILFVSLIVLIISIYPIFLILSYNNFNLTWATLVYFAIISSGYIASVPIILVEIFPTNVRFTGSALAQNISAALCGGTTPMIGTILIKYTNNKAAISFYLILLAFISLFTLIFYDESYKKNLRSNE